MTGLHPADSWRAGKSLERLADAAERIADALEEGNRSDTVLGHDPSDPIITPEALSGLVPVARTLLEESAPGLDQTLLSGLTRRLGWGKPRGSVTAWNEAVIERAIEARGAISFPYRKEAEGLPTIHEERCIRPTSVVNIGPWDQHRIVRGLDVYDDENWKGFRLDRFDGYATFIPGSERPLERS